MMADPKQLPPGAVEVPVEYLLDELRAQRNAAQDEVVNARAWARKCERERDEIGAQLEALNRRLSGMMAAMTVPQPEDELPPPSMSEVEGEA